MKRTDVWALRFKHRAKIGYFSSWRSKFLYLDINKAGCSVGCLGMLDFCVPSFCI